MKEQRPLDVFGMPYLYIERVCSTRTVAIGEAVPRALREVDDFMRRAGISPAGPSSWHAWRAKGARSSAPPGSCI